jgi:type II secretory pathway pseudopilin PulG
MIITRPHHRTSQHSATRRGRGIGGGFTLIEILMVIALMMTMMAMMVMLVGNMLGTSRTAATRATLVKVHGMLQERRDAFSMYQLKRGEIATAVGVLRASGLSERFSRQLAPVVARKLLYRLALPQHHGERTIGTNVSSNADSSELLYWLLKNGNTFGVPNLSDGRFIANELGDTDGDGLIELVDGWGQPLRFYRWPTRLVRSAGPGQSISSADYERSQLLLGAGTKARFSFDPDDDPLDRFGAWVTAQGNESLYHTPYTWHAPLVLSAGSDGIVGLYEPHDTANLGHLAQPNGTDLAIYDNITNLNIPIGSN